MSSSSSFAVTVMEILMCFVCARIVAGEPIVVEWNKPIRLCGSQLMNYVQKLCDGHYNDVVLLDSPGPDNYQTGKTTGIMDECCSVPCTTLHIYENYCPSRNYDTSKDLILPDTSSTTTTTTTTTTMPTTTSTTKRPRTITKLVCPEFGDQYPGGEEAWLSLWKSLGCPF